MSSQGGASARPRRQSQLGSADHGTERIDYSNERQRHERFVGRAALLAWLDQLLVADGADRWVVVTGGPGMGKSALLAEWLARREAVGAVVPHHFIRRGEYDWDDPAKLVGSLVAQIEERFPAVRDPDATVRKHPAARLAAVLARSSAKELLPRGERMVLLIDGLDAYDPPAGARASDPLVDFLPHALPDGVSLLCASRPRHPYMSSLAARDGELVRIDLDDPSSAGGNDATVRAFWRRAAPALGLDTHFVDEAVTCAGGNMQHAVTLQRQLRALPGRQRVEEIPRGLAALLEKSWERIAIDPVVVRGLGILCAAREALTLDELGAVAGWTDEAQRRAFVRGATELLVETQRADGQEEYRLHHASIRAHIAKTLGAAVLREHHGALARRLASWPITPDAVARGYALRHALIHRAEAGGWADAWRLAADTRFLEAKCRELGVHDAEADVARAAGRCRASGDAVIGERFEDLARALARSSHWLRAAPEATPALVWNRLRQLGWSAASLDEQLGLPAGAAFLRIRHGITRESSALVRDLVGHSRPVNACAMTADGRRVISASEDGTLRVWDLESGRALVTLEGHVDGVSACAVTADGRRVVSASWDKTLKVWDLDSGHELATLEGHANRVSACAVTADGRRVVSASWDGTLKLWDLDSGRVITTLGGHGGPVLACAVTPDGRRAVSASSDRYLVLWDLERGRALEALEGHGGPVLACAVTTDGRRAVSASRDGTLLVWDLERGRALTTLQGHTGGVSACAVTADGQRAISASADGTLKVWDLERGCTLADLDGCAGWVLACAVTADGRRMVSASIDGALKVWDLQRGGALARLERHADWVRACASTADGRRAVSASEDGTLKVWDLERGCTLATLAGHAGPVSACVMTADGRHVVSASEDGTLKVWDLERGGVVTLAGQADVVLACAITPDGRRAVTASWDRTLKVWDLEGRRMLATLEGHTGVVFTCAMTADGRRAVSASGDGTLKVWELESGRALATLEGHAGAVLACAVTPDGRRVISASYDRTLRIWDLETGRALATLEGHADAVRACALTVDGRRVVSASDDRTLKVWDLDTCACLLTHRGDVGYTAVAATAAAVIAGDAGGVVWVLDWPPPRRGARSLPAGPAGFAGPCDPRVHDEAPPERPAKPHTILFVAADPDGKAQRALGREVRAIQKELESAGYRDSFAFVTRWAAEPLDLLRELRKLKPTVVHFSSHGGPRRARKQTLAAGPGREGARARDPRGEPRLFLHGRDGRARPVSMAALAETFGAVGASVKLVVLNACYGEPQAEALLAHVDCVIGMGGSIAGGAARCFAIGFYGALGERESIGAAYRQGRAAIILEGLPDDDRPQLMVRAGMDADQLVLATDSK